MFVFLLLSAPQICHYDLCQPDLDLLSSENVPNESIDETTVKDMEVLAAEQKGFGLSSLRESLSMFSGNSHVSLPEDFQGTKEEEERLTSQLRQQRLEADTLRAAMNRWHEESAQRSKIGVDKPLERSDMNLISQWHSELTSRIKEEVKTAEEDSQRPVTSEQQKDRLDYDVYLQCLGPDRLAAITIMAVTHSFTHLGMDNGVKVSALANRIGRDFQDEVIAESYLKQVTEQTSTPARMKVAKQMLFKRHDNGGLQWKGISQKLQMDEPELVWSSSVIMKIGACLLKCLMDVAKTTVRTKDESGHTTVTTQAAFQHAYIMTFGKRIGVIHMHPEIVKSITREPTSNIIDRHLPMVCKPKLWTGAREGGYMLYKSDFIRATPGERLQPTYIRAALEKNGLDGIRSGLDVLGSTGWVINPDVLEVMIEAWNSGEAIAKLAPLEADFPPPPKPDANAGVAAERQWQQRMREIENLKSGFHSQRCFQNFQLEVARAFRNDTFYLPHNLDFRGRAYPLPPYLNQMGADNSRGLLLFSEKKPLGTTGLRWLKIQIANLSGFDKASMSDREKFTDDHIDDVLDSANAGLHGKRWWLQAEDPWQCLAACCELRNALSYSDPTEYPSRLPIHQDGSCNGLQHYAALGGDEVGAQQVNLEPSDRPSDVYTGVSEFVKQKVAEEAAAGDPIAQALDGKITRKIVKQTVMTNVYGVTFMGAMRQVRKQLIDHYPDMSNEMKKAGALYIARQIFHALGSMFTGAHDIQYWLGDCASRITQSVSPEQIEEFANRALMVDSEDLKSKTTADPTADFRSTVIWTTPLGMPVVQPYRKRKMRRIFTTLQNLTVAEAGSNDVVSKRKQLQAFPPNFIHSLDATHMMLSANACNKAGLTFSAVHDSFWTHAGDVDQMNGIIRDSFVQMHSDDIIGRLAAEFHARYGNHLFLAKIPRKNPIGAALQKWREGNKRKDSSKLRELLDEHRRQTLLRSEDPASQAEGRAMETGASIFEKLGGTEADLHAANTLGTTRVGHVPENPNIDARSPRDHVDITDPAVETLFSEIEMAESQFSKDALKPKDNQADAEPAAPRKTGTGQYYSWVWMPFHLRQLPTKGAWDLTRIRDSKYFFS